jgi:tocopherol O-methyltransferase
LTVVEQVGSKAAPATQTGFNAVVERYFDSTLDLWEDHWGEHLHHGYWDPGETPGARGPDRRAATDRLVRQLVAHAGIPAGAHVLDAGCGVGGSALYLAGEHGCTVEGVNLSGAQVDRARQKAQAAGLAERARFRQADALQTGCADSCFDAVWAVEILMHVPDRAAFFAEALRVLRPGGVLAVATWAVREGELTAQEQALVDQSSRHQAIKSLSTLAEHERLARAAGFEAVATVDWSKAVANSWDPDFAEVPKPQGAQEMRELARTHGVGVLGFFYAGPLMLKGFETGAIQYGAMRAVKPAASA